MNHVRNEPLYDLIDHEITNFFNPKFEMFLHQNSKPTPQQDSPQRALEESLEDLGLVHQGQLSIYDQTTTNST